MKYQNSLRPPGRTCGPADTSIVIQTAWFVNRPNGYCSLPRPATISVRSTPPSAT